LLELELEQEQLTPYDNFLYALKAKETKRQYPHRLDKFLTFMGLLGTIEEKCTELYQIANKDINLFQANIIRFISSQKERIEAEYGIPIMIIQMVKLDSRNSLLFTTCLVKLCRHYFIYLATRPYQIRRHVYG